MPLPWIDDKKLDQHIRTLSDEALGSAGNAEARRMRNVVDPFGSLLTARTFDIGDSSSLLKLQNSESALRGMSNALGRFHQNVLGSVEGWGNHDAGYDLESFRHCIVAEVKNKWNTMNSTNRREVVSELNTAVRQKGRGWNGFLVLIVPRRPKRYREPIGKRDEVFETDGASFYELATGEPNALHDLFEELCRALSPSRDIAEYCCAILEASLPPRS